MEKKNKKIKSVAVFYCFIGMGSEVSICRELNLTPSFQGVFDEAYNQCYLYLLFNVLYIFNMVIVYFGMYRHTFGMESWT